MWDQYQASNQPSRQGTTPASWTGPCKPHLALSKPSATARLRGLAINRGRKAPQAVLWSMREKKRLGGGAVAERGSSED